MVFHTSIQLPFIQYSHSRDYSDLFNMNVVCDDPSQLSLDLLIVCLSGTVCNLGLLMNSPTMIGFYTKSSAPLMAVYQK